MDRRSQVTAQLRQLRRELPGRPWLFARVADLLLEAGRTREALVLLRKGAREHDAYSSGWLVLAECLEEQGEEREAEALRERACRAARGIHAAWLQRLRASREDSVRHLELLREAWELDQFSPQLNLELEQCGLRRPAEYEQALRPTAAEAARREQQFRRLMDQHALRRGDTASDASSDTSSDTLLPDPSTPPDAGGIADDLGRQDDSNLDDVVTEDQSPIPVRERGLSEQAERLESLTRPLHLPRGLPEDPLRKVAARAVDLFDPRSMMTRRLAAIYLEQGYPGLALKTLEALLAREAGAADLPGLIEKAREQERRLAEQPLARPRKR